MSLFRALDRTSAVSHPTTAQTPTNSLFTLLCPVLAREPPRRRCFSHNSPTIRPRRVSTGIGTRPRRITSRTSNESTERFFFDALARAASCPEHARHTPPLRKVFDGQRDGRRYQSTAQSGQKEDERDWKKEKRKRKTLAKQASQEEPGNDMGKKKKSRFNPFDRVRQFAESELKALVDYYGPGFQELPQEPMEDDAPLIWNVGDDHQPWDLAHPQDAANVDKLSEMVEKEEADHAAMYETYKLLPVPGVVYLPSDTIRKLLHRLAVLERPTLEAMQRFLSILDDMRTAQIHVTRSEWTTAIYLAGRYMGTVHEEQLQHALTLWRDMEKRAAIRGGLVTMNVLFDIAVKAGKYTLAETFLREMKARNLTPHRHFRVSLIYFYGVQQNSDAVRKAYHDLVVAGDVVDTVVLNAVIAALFRAGEPQAAEHVFERMKRLHAVKSAPLGFPPAYTTLPFNTRIWRGRRALGLHLTHRSRELTLTKAPDDAFKSLQDAAPVAPNSHTYTLLIRHAAHVTADMKRIISLLREMGYNGVPVEGATFVVIFHGFCSHGGTRYSLWTRARLEQTWTEFLDAVTQGLERTWVSRLVVVAVLKAFAKCGADGERLMRVWDEVRRVWTPSADEEEACMRVLRRLVDTVERAQKQQRVI